MFLRVQDAVNQHPQLVPLEVHPVTAEPETEQMPPVAVEAAEAVHLVAADVVGQAAKVPENLQLQFLGQRAQLGGGGGSEDNLKRCHGLCRPQCRRDGSAYEN